MDGYSPSYVWAQLWCNASRAQLTWEARPEFSSFFLDYCSPSSSLLCFCNLALYWFSVKDCPIGKKKIWKWKQSFVLGSRGDVRPLQRCWQSKLVSKTPRLVDSAGDPVQLPASVLHHEDYWSSAQKKPKTGLRTDQLISWQVERCHK